MSAEARRAIEALRAGVPNAEAVKLLGSGQPEVLALYDAAASRLAGSNAATGFFVEGGFGTGKSHALEVIRQRALADGFAVSTIVISKETPLDDLELVYRAAIASLSLPGRPGGDLAEIADELGPKTPRFRAFIDALLREGSGLCPLFPASLAVFEHAAENFELLEDIESFWAGNAIEVGSLKKALKLIGRSAIAVKKVNADDLLEQRFFFASRLIQAAGYRGWVLLFDEVELVATFPAIVTRARCYANMAWLFGAAEPVLGGVLTVMAVTDDFTGVIVQKNHDPAQVTTKVAPKDPAVGARAKAGLALFDDRSRWLLLQPLSEKALDELHSAVAELYATAYRVPVSALDRRSDGLKSARLHVREWITRWDLERFDPTYAPDIQTFTLKRDLAPHDDLNGRDVA